MDKDIQPVAERILNLAIEIICLLTGERFPAVKSGDLVTIAVPPPHSLTVERNSEQKILEVTQKIIELLTGEVPNGSEEVEVSISLEQIVLQEAEKTLEKDPLVENEEVAESEDLLEPTSAPLVPVASVPSPACSNEVQNSNDPEVDMSAMCDPIISKLDLNSAVDFSSCDEGDLSDGEPTAPITVQPTPDDSQTPVGLERTPSTPGGADSLLPVAAAEGQLQSSTACVNVQEPPTTEPLQSTTASTNHIPSTAAPPDHLTNHVTYDVQIEDTTPEPDITQSTVTGKDPLPPTPAQTGQIQPTDSTQTATVTGTEQTPSTTLITISTEPTKPTAAAQGNSTPAKKPGRSVARLLSPDKKPMCPDCGKCFRWHFLPPLENHQKIHKKIKPHCCMYCGKSFYRPSALTKHMRTHET